jgi:pimeloyl-ACP methyl ester carboxylesterase
VPGDGQRFTALRHDGGVPHATTADGVRIAYQPAGPEDAPPLLLLAGQANNHHWWDAVRGDFHPLRRTITLDWRGTGDSDGPDEEYGTEQFAGDAVAVLDALGVARADVYGTSMGGRVAQWIAIRHPERVRALVLGCATPGGPRAVRSTNAVRASLVQPDRAASRRALRELMYTPGWLAAHPGPHFTLGDPHMAPRLRVRHLTASNAHDAWDHLPAVTAPTLVVHGTDDELNPAANAPLLAARIPGARLHLIEGARHAYFEEFRDVASPLVRDFLTSVPD